eukprot:CAMPEP_0172541910 /NCGR_PEP_ID=MMETSP1067-20121228/12627_1 /TAXON_ID=265564 ORGANISM="Thalassiosira punctigera, Strain Tpunct2005C2" /NCGR_SAMPLE_ID=MMETSP1067 /ASSEMBLY_ACC=CAM_ASM_000444 /LENGTH=977 /DNA_ID=CAMNT_0013328039 /DNA_START=276 /DNA_END=3209 /DNA_ORIENTATION=-
MPEEQRPPGEEAKQPSQQQQEHKGLPSGEKEQHHYNEAQLFNRLRNQVSFYFSLQNLARDKYLRNMLTAEHPEMPSPRPAQLMCPVGVITNFPKVRDICAQFETAGREGQLPKPPALLLANALEGSDLVTISPDGNWIGPVMQQLPPPALPQPAMGGAPAPMGVPPAHHFQQPHHFQQQAPHLNFQQGSYPHLQPNHMSMMVPPGAAAMQYQPPGMPPSYPPPAHGVQYPNNVPMNQPPIISLGGSDSPSSASLESVPSQQQQAAQQPQQGVNASDNVFVAVMDLPPGGVNPIEILSAFTTETIRPKSAFLDNLNMNLWFVSFGSEADAKAAILASAGRTIAGMHVRAKLNNELPASSTASLSSTSVPGQMVQQPHPMPVPRMGGAAYPHLPQGHSPPPPGMGTPPPPMGTNQSNMPVAYPPQYGMPPPQTQPPPQLAGMPPPGHYPPHQPYFNPPQQMQQAYPSGYISPQQQQGGPLQPQQQMMQPHPPHPPHPQMGNRFGVVPPPPPPPRSGYPGGPPPPYPYQGIHQQYVDGYGGPHYQQYAHLHPPPRQYNDRRQVGPSGAGATGGVFHDPHGHSRSGKKKKKNQQQQQQQQQYRRESYGSSSNDNNNGFRRNNEYNYGQQQHLRHDGSASPVLSDHRGGLKTSWKQKRGEHDQQSFRRSHGNPLPSFHRNYNRNHHNNDRSSSSDTTPSAGLSSNKQGSKAEDRDIFSSSDFPGLGGLGGDDKPEKLLQQGNNKSSNNGDGSNKQQLVGYASALLKKKEMDHKKEADIVAPTAAATTDNHEVDSITRQTEEMEREILSEFHDLSLIGDVTNTIDATSSSSPSPATQNNPQGPQHNNNAAATDDKTDGSQTVGTASSSNMDASARSNPNTNNLPILPAGPFLENEGGDVAPQAAYSSVSPGRHSLKPPVVDVMNSQDFPSRESTQIVDDGGVVPLTKEQTPPTVVPSNNQMMQVDEKSKPPGAWGSKRFADVI